MANPKVKADGTALSNKPIGSSQLIVDRRRSGVSKNSDTTSDLTQRADDEPKILLQVPARPELQDVSTPPGVMDLPMDAYAYDIAAGEGSTVYVLDSGVNTNLEVGFPSMSTICKGFILFMRPNRSSLTGLALLPAGFSRKINSSIHDSMSRIKWKIVTIMEPVWPQKPWAKPMGLPKKQI